MDTPLTSAVLGQEAVDIPKNHHFRSLRHERQGSWDIIESPTVVDTRQVV